MGDVVIRSLFATVIGLALIISGCTVAQRSDPPPPAAAPPSNQVGPLPADCADRITESNQARKALADVQCLIATIDDRRARPGPSEQPAIIFEGNTCAVNGAQAALLRNFSDVVVRGNRFSGRGDRAVQLDGESTGVAVIDNVVRGQMRPFEIDRQSEPGFQESGNTSG